MKLLTKMKKACKKREKKLSPEMTDFCKQVDEMRKVLSKCGVSLQDTLLNMRHGK